MKWFAIIISILIALMFLFLAMAAAALFAIARDDVIEDELNERRQESKTTTNKRK